MPIYEFECAKCVHVYERFMKIDEPYDDLECPSCGAKKPKKLVTSFRTNAGQFPGRYGKEDQSREI